jgi:fatty-acyl-CoA synthase
VWLPFQSRFKIPHIVEFYGATEGNVMLFNFDGKPGAVGRIPWFAKKVYERIKFVKFDVETEQPVRGADGFCIECEVDETGEAVGRISDEAGDAFEGYGDRKADEKKILHDVFDPGDSYFRTGDLMRMGKNGYVYFMDRIGDTFRWKGENVATSEVAEALSVFEGVQEANVYGVHVPGADGRAGMAAIVAGPGLDVDKLGEHIKAELPTYARPIFLRLQPEMEITGTFKHRKVDLQKEGFDPGTIADQMFFFDDVAGVYVPLDAKLFEKICSGSMRF